MVDRMDLEQFDFEQYVDDVDGDGDTAEGQRKRKKRVRNWTAEDRARHRVFERSRREAFNERLNELAGLLPSLKSAKDTQLSKHVIVDESVKYHASQQTTIDELSRSLDELKAQHEQLLVEVAAWQQAANLSHLSHPQTGHEPMRGLAPVQVGPQAVSLPPQSGFESNAEVASHQLHPFGMPEMQQYAADRPRSILPELDNYPESLEQLAPDRTRADDTAALDTLDGSLPRPGVSETRHSLDDMQDSFVPSPNTVYQDQAQQRLFDRFQDPASGSANAFGSARYEPPVTVSETSPLPFDMQDFWRTQWSADNPGNWQTDYSEMDLNAMQLRNNTSITNM